MNGIFNKISVYVPTLLRNSLTKQTQWLKTLAHNTTNVPLDRSRTIAPTSTLKTNYIKTLNYSEKCTPSKTKITPCDRKMFVDIFESFDQDEDGNLNLEEFKEAVKTSICLSDDQFNSVFEPDSCKQVYSLHKYLKILENILNRKKFVDDDLYYLFLIYDFDKDGKVDVKEVPKLLAIMMNSDTKEDEENEDDCLMEYDEDGDGCMTYEEVKEWLWAEHNPFEQC